MNEQLASSRIRQIIEEATNIPPPTYHPHYAEFRVISLAEQTNIEHFEQVFDSIDSDSVREERMRKLCLSIYEELLHTDDHFSSIERSLSKMVEFSIRKDDIDPDLLTKQAVDLLRRLLPDDPACTEPNSAEICQSLESRYFVPDADTKNSEVFRVAQALDRNTICAVLHILTEPAEKKSWGGFAVAQYVDLLGELLRSAVHLSSYVRHPSTICLLFLESFIWTSWQRCVTLSSWSKLPYDRTPSRAHLASRNVDLLASLEHVTTINTISWTSETRQLPASMCPWAFKLMRSDPEAYALKTDHFLSRYDKYFGAIPARCIQGPDQSFQQCSGEGPSACRRFTGAFIEDQSSHRSTCRTKCVRLYWDEKSYRQVQGAPAVRLVDPSDGLLTYCAASEATMTVSHVWSHGQGGRPERPRPLQPSTGFNQCLHQRYCDIARGAGCNSYWIDTACIPQNHDLRRAAIGQINGVFERSRLMLICDRDLMNVDISSKIFPVLEKILVMLLVCDWNVRAWTLLEGIKGAKNTYILCKDDQIVSLLDVIDTVYKSSCLSLGGLGLTIHHLIHEEARAQRYDWKYVNMTARGFGDYNIEDSARLLNHRHASRDGDELVIWSLLTGQVAFTPEEFWKRRQGVVPIVRTAFLMTDAPRMTGVLGRSWAPIQPNHVSAKKTNIQNAAGSTGTQTLRNSIAAESISISQRFANDGIRSWPGTISEDGLSATWLMCRFADVRSRLSNIVCCLKLVILCIKATQRSVFYRLQIKHHLRRASYYWQMCFLASAVRRRFQIIAMECQIEDLRRCALLQACSKQDPGYLWPLPLRSEDGKSTVCVVVEAADDLGTSWVWRKLVAWSNSVPLPPFLATELFIV